MSARIKRAPAGGGRTVAALLAGATVALGATACGEDERSPGAPAPPEKSADTDCEELNGPPPPVGTEPAREGPPPYGFNDHAGLVGTVPVSEDADLHERAGSTLWRVAIDWRFAEPAPGELELKIHDAIYCEALARGIRPIFHITGAPEWAEDSQDCPVTSCLNPPRESALDDLTDLAREVAERYPEVAAIEVWNEPNLATFWAEPDPKRYADVLAAIDEGVEESGTSIPVLGGALSNTSRSDETKTGYAPFLNGMYAAGAAAHMDAISFHPYPVAPLDSHEERFTRSMAAFREILRREGEADLPIWITEVGLPVGGDVTEADQAQTLQEIYRRLDEPRIEAVVFHTLLEGEEEAGAGTGFGWVVPGEGGELDPRPVFERFAG